MRDILITLIVFGSVPFIFKRPYIGILMWCWISYMNPHRASWGFAYDMPFAAIIAGATMLAMLIQTKQVQKLDKNSIVVLWIVFLLWTGVTTIFAFFPESAVYLFKSYFKIMLMTFVAIMLINDQKKLDHFIWVIVLSLGYFGVKGGVFTIATGGSFRVWGPPSSFIEGNNELALALLMLIPLANYLRIIATKKWVKIGFLGAIFLMLTAALGSQSRGAFVAAGAMGVYFWLKSDKKFLSGIAVTLAGASFLMFMPKIWWDRMSTIQSYEEDASALGRINAWWTEFNIANDNIFGAGFNHSSSLIFAQYAPNPTDVHAAHSIYFQVLGGHGWIGFALFMAFCILSLRLSKKITKKTKEHTDLAWANLLSRMVYVSLIAYAVGGAFLSLAYFDLPYHLMAILVMTNIIVDRELAKPVSEELEEVTEAKDLELKEAKFGKGIADNVSFNRY
ncbi:MAG: putative O-glycosylation ligase, exosortase A system-associated [Piscirickettsiaceae bacterium]|nr:MAG: putative O-glycosylation ligase, exosortase A system-associated [Piscirickettsiaceae bacterium]